MESKVIYAKSSDEAVEKLLESTNAKRSSIEVLVKQKPSKGFLGLGSKDGIYELTYKLVEDKVIVKEEKISPKLTQKEEAKAKNEVENKEILEDKETVNITQEDEVRVARDFVETLLKNADVDADVDIKVEDNLMKVRISGDQASCLIGRRGDTLDAIQFLTGLALNRVNKDSKTRVFVDIENYRKKREESLKRYCYKAAREVAKTRRTKKLDYMNPYERRIIHSALQNDRYVITYSEGTDPYRRVVIECKNKR